jgi:hypothetical protein
LCCLPFITSCRQQWKHWPSYCWLPCKATIPEWWAYLAYLVTTAFSQTVTILFIHLCLGLTSRLFPSGFLTNNLHAVLFFPIRATCPAHLILHDLIILIILDEEYKPCSFLHLPVTSSIFGPNILLSTLFSNTLSLFSSLNVSKIN